MLMRRVLAIALCNLVFTALANADALYFQKIVVKTRSEVTCLRFASDVARLQGFQNTHKSASEVAGTKNGVYVAITCVARGEQDAIAVVMAVSPNFDNARNVGQFVADKVKGMVCFDSPC